MEEKLLVMVAPCIPPSLARGIPDIVLSPERITREVLDSCNAGANIVHLHVWDEHGHPTTEPAAFGRTIQLIRDKCDIIIEGSTGGMSELTTEERSIALTMGIDVATLNAGSVNYAQGVYVNSPEDVAFWAQKMHSRGIKADIAIFEPGMIANSLQLAEKGWIAPPFFFTFVLGQEGAMPASPKNLLFLSETLPSGSLWCVAGHGGHDLWMSSLAMNMGGHVRAGFEDNPYYRPGELAKGNAQLIERLVRLAREVGREIASPSEARGMLGLKG